MSELLLPSKPNSTPLLLKSQVISLSESITGTPFSSTTCKTTCATSSLSIICSSDIIFIECGWLEELIT